MNYTIISGTNRGGSNTYKIALLYQQLLKEKGIEAKLLTLENVNPLSEKKEFKKITQQKISMTSFPVNILKEIENI